MRIATAARIALTLASVAAALGTTAVEARQIRQGGFNNGPIIIKGPVDCEKKLVQKCHWEGDRHICVWVESNECEIY